MDLQELARRIFGKEYLQGPITRIASKSNKKLFLNETREWLGDYLQDFSDPEPVPSTVVSSITITSDMTSIAAENYQSPGRIGTLDVGFTLDKSFGIVAINQDGLNVTAACRFATVSASCGVFSGKWMFELQLCTSGIMQIGWCTNLCTFSVDRGCGDTENSYAYDGSRNRSWNMVSDEYGQLWKIGDVIGVCINLDNATIEFYRNGHSMGIAFQGIRTGLGIIYIPCISLVDGENVIANFGSKPFRHSLQEYQALQRKPDGKIIQAERILKWLKNLCSLVVPNEPKITNSNITNDITDRLFWDRLFSIFIYYLHPILQNQYCLFNNFLPFVSDLAGLKNDKEEVNLERFYRLMDAIWMNAREKYIDKMLYIIFNHIINSFKQVSDTLQCTNKMNELKICRTFASHETTRKYLLTNFLDIKFDFLKLLHHKPAEEKFIDDFVGDAWWDTNGQIPAVEKNKKSFKTAFIKIDKISEDLEKQQCKFLKVLMNNTDGNEHESSSRNMYLKKFRKVCWHELEYTRSDIRSKMNSHVAYASFQRTMRILRELWSEEVGDEIMMMPSTYFFDHTIQYQNCDRIGGIESYLLRTYKEDVIKVLGEDHPIFGPRTTGQQTPGGMMQIQMTEFRALVSLLEGNDLAMEAFVVPMPTTSNSNGQVLQAILTPLLRESLYDNTVNNKENKLTLLELFEDLILFFTASVSKHCHRFSNSQAYFQKSSIEYNLIYTTYNKMSPKEKEDALGISIKNSLKLLEKDMQKRAKKVAWIETILMAQSRTKNITMLFKSLVKTVVDAEKTGNLFVFLPDFYLEACVSFVQLLIRDFKWLEDDKIKTEVEQEFKELAELMIRLIGDNRIKHIDSKKLPITILSSYVTSTQSIRLLETLELERSMEFISKLIQPYTDRHWKATNWILVRFWHGTGYGFRYSTLPHHSLDADNLSVPNYVMNHILAAPSPYYQNLIRIKLYDQTGEIPILLDSIITELHWTFGEFLTPMQELQRAIERNEQLLMMGRLYKMCSNYFDKTIGLLRVLDMFINLAPNIFWESYYPESAALTKRIIQVVLLIIHRISTKQGCFRTVMNSRISVLENVEYFPIQSACMGIILGILKNELEAFDEEDIIIPKLCRIILMDSSFDYENLKILIGLPDTKHSPVVCLHDYENILLEKSELEEARKFLKMMLKFHPLLSALQLIPDDELCMICYIAPFDVKFSPCGHNSCLACISYYITKNRQCFFCKRIINKVIRIDNNEVIETLTEKSLVMQQ